MASANWSILGTRNGSFRQAQLMSVKSTQTLYFLFFFFTTTVFDSHLGKNTSLIAPICFNFSTSSLTASTYGFPDLLGFYFFGGIKGFTFSLCVIKVGSTLSTLYGVYVNMSKFYTNDRRTSTQSFACKLFTI